VKRGEDITVPDHWPGGEPIINPKFWSSFSTYTTIINNLLVDTMADRLRTHRDERRTRNSRSRSPRRHDPNSRRTRSPHRHHPKRIDAPEAAPRVLPYNSRQLTKRDYDVFKPMFALYLDIQKGKVLEDMDGTEVRGRWKSYIGKW